MPIISQISLTNLSNSIKTIQTNLQTGQSTSRFKKLPLFDNPSAALNIISDLYKELQKLEGECSVQNCTQEQWNLTYYKMLSAVANNYEKIKKASKSVKHDIKKMLSMELAEAIEAKKLKKPSAQDLQVIIALQLQAAISAQNVPSRAQIVGALKKTPNPIVLTVTLSVPPTRPQRFAPLPRVVPTSLPISPNDTVYMAIKGQSSEGSDNTYSGFWSPTTHQTSLNRTIMSPRVVQARTLREANILEFTHSNNVSGNSGDINTVRVKGYNPVNVSENLQKIVHLGDTEGNFKIKTSTLDGMPNMRREIKIADSLDPHHPFYVSGILEKDFDVPGKGKQNVLFMRKISYDGKHSINVESYLTTVAWENPRRAFFLAQVLCQGTQALKAVHEKDVVQSDFAQRNLLVEKITKNKISVVLCDFGNAYKTGEMLDATLLRHPMKLLSPLFLQGKEPASFEMDWFQWRVMFIDSMIQQLAIRASSLIFTDDAGKPLNGPDDFFRYYRTLDGKHNSFFFTRWMNNLKPYVTEEFQDLFESFYPYVVTNAIEQERARNPNINLKDRETWLDIKEHQLQEQCYLTLLMKSLFRQCTSNGNFAYEENRKALHSVLQMTFQNSMPGTFTVTGDYKVLCELVEQKGVLTEGQCKQIHNISKKYTVSTKHQPQIPTGINGKDEVDPPLEYRPRRPGYNG